jgi:hypothetical protein
LFGPRKESVEAEDGQRYHGNKWDCNQKSVLDGTQIDFMHDVTPANSLGIPMATLTPGDSWSLLVTRMRFLTNEELPNREVSRSESNQ